MRENLNHLSLDQLYDLLLSGTERLLMAIEQKADGFTLRDLKLQVEEIQFEIRSREGKV
jgi:hypothetical protein